MASISKLSDEITVVSGRWRTLYIRPAKDYGYAIFRYQMVSDEYEDYDDGIEDDDCDCLEAELDILTGIERCHVCGRTRWLNSQEFERRLKLEAEWAEAYYAEMEKHEEKP